METTFSQAALSSDSSHENSLFVGCLDPGTTKTDIVRYFSQFDPLVKAKLIINFKTGQSKQCALLFLSSTAACDLILQQEHYLHQRRLRVDRAQAEFKGKKNEGFASVQVSGLDPGITIEEVYQFFGNFEGFSKARLIQGLHQKQKKVAVVQFNTLEAAQELLKNSHVRIGERNCKLAEYVKEKPQTSAIQTPQMQGNHQPFNSGFFQASLEPSGFMSMLQPSQVYSQGRSGGSGDSKSLMSEGFGGGFSKPLQPLRLNPHHDLQHSQTNENQIRKGSGGAFLHAVEVEDDDLFRIFCGEKGKQGKKDPRLFNSADKSFRKVVDSKETAPEED